MQDEVCDADGYCIMKLCRNLLIELLNYLLITYLLTPWRGVLLEKLTGSQLVNKFPAFNGPRRLIIALTSAHYLSLSCTCGSP